eukprot:comp23675_c0_seq1/m.40527 comp23675_c0_seq1/g.40527  ORF comp23675_c0_seq1/g.40527 comp23675_c0_seq1/m.40527 type:complete len:511 (-) comp23675_c0_seq1:577-2109(-)
MAPSNENDESKRPLLLKGHAGPSYSSADRGAGITHTDTASSGPVFRHLSLVDNEAIDTNSLQSPSLSSTQHFAYASATDTQPQRGNHRLVASFKSFWSSVPLNYRLAFVFAVYVVTRSIDRVFLKRVNDRMTNYNMLYTGLIWPVVMGTVKFMAGLVYVAYMRYLEGRREYTLAWASPSSKLASPVGPFPQWTIGRLAFIDQVSSIVTTLPAPFLSMTAQGLLGNSNLIFIAILSSVWLGVRYSSCHVAGCLLIVMSGLVSIVVELQSGTGFSYKDSLGLSHQTSFVWYFIFIVGHLPQAFASCWRQKCMKGVNLDVFWLSAWSGVWQILWGVVLFGVNWIPLPEPARRYYPGDTPKFMYDAWMCFIGYAPSDHPADLACSATDGSAMLWFSYYIIFNLVFSTIGLWLTKEMSAMWTAVSAVLCMGVSSIFSMSHALMGAEAEPLTIEQWLGLTVACIAMWVYNFEDERDFNGELVKGTHERPGYTLVQDSAPADSRPLLRKRTSASSQC